MQSGWHTFQMKRHGILISANRTEEWHQQTINTRLHYYPKPIEHST
jgi:hypothetical protein